MRIPGAIPGSLGIRGGTPTFTTGGAAYNYAIDEMPWLSAASERDYGNRRIKRATAPFRKQQFDASATPGEQSLDGYWLRSQQSFHGGAGLRFSDPTGDNTDTASIRFWTSKGLDVWTAGEVSLLNEAAASTDTLTSVVDVVGFLTVAEQTPVVAFIQDSNVGYVRGSDGEVTTDAWAGGTALSITSNGTDLFIASTTGIYRAALPNYGGALSAWTQIYTTTPTSAVLAWVKSRLIYGTGQDLYELDPYPGAPPAALPTAIYTSNSPSWQWTSVSESTSAIYAVGNANSQSTVLKFTLDTSTATPALSGGAEACTLPGGEIAYSVFGYLGSYVGIGTNKGARVAVADTEGNLSYGPLLFESSTPVTSFAGRDRFLYCNYADADDADYKLARIDLSTELATLRFAYATDLIAMSDAAVCTNVVFFPGTDNLAFTTANEFYYETSDKVSAGWLITSRVRFSTLEPKTFRGIRVRGPQLEGSLAISTISAGDVTTPVTVFGVGQTPGTQDIVLTNATAQDFMSIRFDLSRGEVATVGAQFAGWQIKALPASPRQRLVTLPLWCYDYEKDKNGLRTGGSRTAITRLIALEDREAAGSLISFQDLDAGITSEAFIEELTFEQSAPPPSFEGWGGVVTITLRLL